MWLGVSTSIMKSALTRRPHCGIMLAWRVDNQHKSSRGSHDNLPEQGPGDPCRIRGPAGRYASRKSAARVKTQLEPHNGGK